MLEKEKAWYMANRRMLQMQFGDKYIVIVGHTVIGAYVSHAQAHTDTTTRFHAGMFLIRNPFYHEEA